MKVIRKAFGLCETYVALFQSKEACYKTSCNIWFLFLEGQQNVTIACNSDAD